MERISKYTLYLCDLNNNLTTEDLQVMIDLYVLNRRSTNGFSLLIEEKTKEIEWEDEHPLNYTENSSNPNVWEKCLCED